MISSLRWTLAAVALCAGLAACARPEKAVPQDKDMWAWPDLPCPMPDGQMTARLRLTEIRNAARNAGNYQVVALCNQCEGMHPAGPNHQEPMWEEPANQVFMAWRECQNQPIDWAKVAGHLEHDP